MQISGYAAVRDDVHGTADHDRGDAVGFEFPGRQTDGLVADGSEWNEQGNIHFICKTGVCDGGSIFIDRQAMAVLRG